MRAFDHYSPRTLAEATELLSRLDGNACVIAGGTDLLLKMRAGALAPANIINIKRLAELKGISLEADGSLRLGALTTLRDLTRSALIRERYPCLAASAGWMASEQIRSFATVGGNLCNASPSADLAPPLLALDTTTLIAGPGGERDLPLDEFFLGPGQSALKAGELLVSLTLPPPRGRAIYIKHAPRAFMDIAVVGVGLRVEVEGEHCREARIVLGAVAPVPLPAKRAEAELVGQSLTPERIARAAGLAATECAPIDDVRGSAWYRREMVAVAVRRGLERLAVLDE